MKRRVTLMLATFFLSVGPLFSQTATTGYAGLPTQTIPELTDKKHVDKGVTKGIRSCNAPAETLGNDKKRANADAGCLVAAKYYQSQNDSASATIAFQKSCALGDGEACISLASMLNAQGDTTSARLVWEGGAGCHSNQKCTEALFRSYDAEATPDKNQLDRYGRSLCENAFQMDVCKELKKAGLPVDYQLIAQHKKDSQIADLKTRINDLERQAQDDEASAIQLETQAQQASGAGGFGAIAGAIGQKGAQSARNDAAKERAQAATLRQQLIALQGNSDGAEPRGMSVLGVIETGLAAGSQKQ